MSELWYPPNFADWPPEPRGVWYSINADREEVLRELRKGIGIENPEKSTRLQISDIAAAVEQLSDGERILRADASKSACLSTLAEEAGIKEKTSARNLLSSSSA